VAGHRRHVGCGARPDPLRGLESTGGDPKRLGSPPPASGAASASTGPTQPGFTRPPSLRLSPPGAGAILRPTAPPPLSSPRADSVEKIAGQQPPLDTRCAGLSIETMAGTVLAVILSSALIATGGLFLLKHAERLIEDAVREQFSANLSKLIDARTESAIDEFRKEYRFDLEEWFDKFSTASARVAKREQRRAKSERNGVEPEGIEEAPLSMAYLRRMP